MRSKITQDCVRLFEVICWHISSAISIVKISWAMRVLSPSPKNIFSMEGQASAPRQKYCQQWTNGGRLLHSLPAHLFSPRRNTPYNSCHHTNQQQTRPQFPNCAHMTKSVSKNWMWKNHTPNEGHVEAPHISELKKWPEELQRYAPT